MEKSIEYLLLLFKGLNDKQKDEFNKKYSKVIDNAIDICYQHNIDNITEKQIPLIRRYKMLNGDIETILETCFPNGKNDVGMPKFIIDDLEFILNEDLTNILSINIIK